MSKFKVGDRVKVIDKGEVYSAYDEFIKKVCPEYTSFFRNGKSRRNGDIGVVVAVHQHLERYHEDELLVVKAGDEVFIIAENGVELVESASNFSIHITSDGKTTTAVLKYGKAVVCRTEANCSPDDTFNFKTGAELAFNRLFEEKPNIPEEFWDRWESGKIVVNCRTEEESKAFLKQAHGKGFKWGGGSSLLKLTRWEFYEEDTCYSVNFMGVCLNEVGFSNAAWYKFKGFTIITYSDLISGKLPPKEEFKPYIAIEFNDKKVGEIGTPTPFTDIIGTPLEVGDTVEVFGESESKGERSICKDKDCFFVMGLKSCEFKNGISGDWKIIKKRSHAKIEDGEEVDVIVYRKKP